MFPFSENKNSGQMKIKKFYYFSPEKLKLVPIENFIPKVMIFLGIFALLFITLTVVISHSLINDSKTLILKTQNEIIEKEYQKEINLLEKKYINLAQKFNGIANSSNDLRLSVNLEPINLDDRNYGIGGSQFVNTEQYSLLVQKEKLSIIYEYANHIEMNLNFESSNYEEIKNKYIENEDLYKRIPAISPVNSSIGDRFGVRFHPILNRKKMHNGLDFLANTGERVFAPGEGVVTYRGKKGGYGKVLRINHGYGYETIYAHLSKYKVKKGQKVKRGDLIALSGNSGSLSTGPHLHYEIRHNGICLNPKNFIFDNLTLFE